MKQQKQHKEMLEALGKGDKIVTNGGLICEIVKAEEDFIKVKLNDDVIVKVDRAFIARKIEDNA
jgi:preprotein translocase subunit YajC